MFSAMVFKSKLHQTDGQITDYKELRSYNVHFYSLEMK